MTDHIDVDYVNVCHLVSRLDGVDIVYRLSQIFLAVEFRDLKEKHDFMGAVVGYYRESTGHNLEIKPEELSTSTTVLYIDCRDAGLRPKPRAG